MHALLDPLDQRQLPAPAFDLPDAERAQQHHAQHAEREQHIATESKVAAASGLRSLPRLRGRVGVGVSPRVGPFGMETAPTRRATRVDLPRKWER
ncbi:hypothetical protein BEL01nite_55600 [Bradyrhizobium elkanii]|nr:hypothetical protein BEL01nite_55600 [Bradyrhizobium elkanii]